MKIVKVIGIVIILLIVGYAIGRGWYEISLYGGHFIEKVFLSIFMGKGI